MTNATARKPDGLAIPYQLPQPPDMSPDIVHFGVLDKWLEDDNLWVPMTPTVSFKPLLLSASQGYYVNLLRVRQSGVLSRHRHTGPVHAIVLRGRWYYLEHDWVADQGWIRTRAGRRDAHLVRARRCKRDDHVVPCHGRVHLRRSPRHSRRIRRCVHENRSGSQALRRDRSRRRLRKAVHSLGLFVMCEFPDAAKARRMMCPTRSGAGHLDRPAPRAAMEDFHHGTTNC